MTIPNSVASIGIGVFDGCSSLSEINVDAENPSYSSADGILFDKSRAVLLCTPAGKAGSISK